MSVIVSNKTSYKLLQLMGCGNSSILPGSYTAWRKEMAANMGISLDTSLTGRVKRLSAPKNANETLFPIYEAISNSLHSVYERYQGDSTRAGHVAVQMSGDHSSFLCNVADNGEGLTTTNFEAFKTVDTPHKIQKGGKGVGRLLWLAAFEKIRIASSYYDGSERKERSFNFQGTSIY